MNKKQIIGIVIFLAIIVGVIAYKLFKDNTISVGNLTTVYVATGGGKEDFLADERVNEILRKKYKLDVVYDTWSNGKTVSIPLIRESVGLGNGDATGLTVRSEGASKYDVLFTSDERFYDYYRLRPVGNEAERYTVLEGGLTLNTPIVIYSWGKVVDALMKEGIVTQGEDGVYYITNMTKLLDYILEGKKWKDIGVDIYGNVKISSTDPVTSSPGATYYGLLLNILSEASITDQNIGKYLPKLKEFYTKAGYMWNAPADLFERYLKTGMGGEPMIVDYEKSIVDFANANPKGFAEVKDDIRILYPSPTIWNSHCLTIFTDNGKLLYKAFEDEEIQKIAFDKYGFRTGVTGGNYDVSSLGIAIPKSITNTVSSLKMDAYNKLIDYLK